MTGRYMFSRQDVIKMVDAVFHEFASSYRTEAKKSVEKMMDRQKPKASQSTKESKCPDCGDSKPVLYCERSGNSEPVLYCEKCGNHWSSTT